MWSLYKMKSWIKKIQNFIEAYFGDIDSTSVSPDFNVTAFTVDAVSTITLDSEADVSIVGATGVNMTADEVVITGTGAIQIPVGDNAARPGTPAEGMLRINTEAGPGSYVLEVYMNGAWGTVTVT